jgi:hypothetical protein
VLSDDGVSDDEASSGAKFGSVLFFIDLELPPNFF